MRSTLRASQSSASAVNEVAVQRATDLLVNVYDDSITVQLYEPRGIFGSSDWIFIFLIML